MTERIQYNKLILKTEITKLDEYLKKGYYIVQEYPLNTITMPQTHFQLAINEEWVENTSLHDEEHGRFIEANDLETVDKYLMDGYYITKIHGIFGENENEFKFYTELIMDIKWFRDNRSNE